MSINFQHTYLQAKHFQKSALMITKQGINLCVEKWGTVTSGILIGLCVVNLVDYYFQGQCQNLIRQYYTTLNRKNSDLQGSFEKGDKSYDDKPFSSIESIVVKKTQLTFFFLILAPLSIALDLFHHQKKPSYLITAFLLLIGSVIGKKMFDLHQYYGGGSAQQISELMKEYYLKLSDELEKKVVDLRCFRSYFSSTHLNYVNAALREFIPVFETVKLANCGLTNDDIKKLAKAGFFTGVSSVDISHNPQISSKGILWIGAATKGSLKKLNISGLKLRDEDLDILEKSKSFASIQDLAIKECKEITGKGIAYLVNPGFENLETLRVQHSKKVFKENFSMWNSDSFEKFKNIYIDERQMTHEQLQQLAQNEWFKSLTGFQVKKLGGLLSDSDAPKYKNFVEEKKSTISNTNYSSNYNSFNNQYHQTHWTKNN